MGPAQICAGAILFGVALAGLPGEWRLLSPRSYKNRKINENFLTPFLASEQFAFRKYYDRLASIRYSASGSIGKSGRQRDKSRLGVQQCAAPFLPMALQ